MINKKRYVKINKLFYVILIIIIVFIDIISKNWITQNIKLNEVKKIFFILNFSHVHNYGAAFSFLSDQNGWQRWLLSAISTITILVITKMIINSEKKEIKKITSYSLIIAGAIGNLIDRVFYGFVVDFIDINFNDWHLATFNIADCSIFLGILILT